MELSRQVRGNGAPSAPVLVVGEAPGSEELDRGIPFVGPSGRLLRKLMLEAGIHPDSARFENVIERKLEANNIDSLYLDGTKHTIRSPELVDWINDLRARITSLQPRIVIAVGETALNAVTDLNGIGQYHCFPIPPSVLAGPTVLPIYHPAAALRNTEFTPWISFGLRKAASILVGAQDRPRNLILAPSIPQIREILSRTTEPCAIDLEVFHNEITCLAIAIGSDSISIPLSIAGGSYWPEADEIIIWKELAQFLSSSATKIFQNFIFDCFHLRRNRLPVLGPIQDTMLMAHVLHPELPKGLDDLARLYTLAPPWKNHRDWSASVDPEALWRYNALDAAITLEVYDRLRLELTRKDLLTFYEGRTAPLIPRVLSVCLRGWRIDQTALTAVREEMAHREADLRERIKAASPVELNPRSPTQVKNALLAFGINIPTKDGKETTDRKALLKLAKKYPENPLIPLLLEFSKVAKLRSTYGDVALDPDGRLRFSINIGGTKSGRFSSSQTPWKTGMNSQNVPSRDPDSDYNFRQVIVPEDGNVLIQLDLKQAEARIVAWLAHEEMMSRIFTEGGDIHTRTASLIFGEDITKHPPAEYKRRRYLGKKTVHSANYGMSAPTFVDACLLEADLVISLEEATRLLSGYFRAFSRIPEWHRTIQNTLAKTRTLRSPQGRTRHFHGRLEEELFREAYSFIPQATVADALNEGWIKFTLTPISKIAPVLQQGHDSLLLECPSDRRDEVLSALSAAFDSVHFVIHGIEHHIPYDIAVGPNWRDVREI